MEDATPHMPSIETTGQRIQDRLDVVIANLRDYAIFAMDTARRIVDWNVGAERILGYRAEEIVGHNADVVFTPEDRASGQPEAEQRKATIEGRAEDERWHLRRGGERFFGSGILAAVRDEHGALLGFVKIMRDFTEQRRAQDALARSEERYRLLVESIKDYAIFTLDAAGMVTSWTQAAERIVGYGAEEIIGQSFAVFFLPEDQERGDPQREIEIASSQGRVEAVGWRVRKDGTRFWCEEIATAMYDETGQLRGISKITRDVTQRMLADAERERLLRQATEANRIKDEFLGTISHELRTPLNAILGWTRMLQRGDLDEQTAARALQTIDRNARNQAKLIDDLLDVSRIITGKLKLNVQPLDLIGAISAALDAVRPAAAAKGIRLNSALDPDLETVSADPDRIAQVIWNLLANAIKFTPPGGHVTIGTRRVGHEAEIVVQDTGEGIHPAFLPYVFDRFRQADSSSTRTQTGLGLGLAIVRHLVELHGGSVSVESAGLGKGATFHVRLPTNATVKSLQEEAVTHAMPPPTSGPVPTRSLTGIHILAIEDNDDTRELLSVSLEQAGAIVMRAASAREGLDLLQRRVPQVVLVDIAMPEEDGYTFIRRLRASEPRLSSICAIAVTAYARARDIQLALATGFQAHVAKPIDMNRLIDLILQLLAPATPQDSRG